MFDFLKRLFGKKQPPSDQPVEEERVESRETEKTSYSLLDEQKAQSAAADRQPAVESKPIAVQETKVVPQQTEPPRNITPVAPHTKTPVPLKATEAKKGTATSANRPAQRRVVSPRSQTASARQPQRSSVYIGLDFGTTFTKAAYVVGQNSVHTKYSIKFGQGKSKDAYYLPSVLYFDPMAKKLKIDRDTDHDVEIRYFKYSMISDALEKNQVINDPAVKTSASKEQLCCVFYLSYVIHLIRESVLEKFGNTVVNENTAWYINMGVPLEAHKSDERADQYKKTLEVAYLLERTNPGLKEIDIRVLDQFFAEHRTESNPNINILPEIYAEVLLYQQYLNAPEGFYTVVDIGGGTEDIATFLKTTDRYDSKVECLAQKVIGYGYDAISEKVVKKINGQSITRAKAFLRKDIDFNDEEDIRDNLPNEVDFKALMDARLACRTLFGTCVQSARKTRNDILKQTMQARLPMHVFVMGGAQSVAFYRLAIQFMMMAQEHAGFPFLKEADVFDYLERDTRLEIRDDQRLVISQMLAQPFEMIPEIENMPWDLKESDVTSKGKSWIELAELQNELYPN